ncbi:hypothetical protein [Streptomyces mirabilis]|uniref:hypothetical protein n=1 Tax=Streptomyces mirabilis TaxID=68239 RepID=UPI00224E2F9C|nr:hypothetical protein [Streptomyces mirabilis]MCX4617956.1 hypothetical protein [Streptomyces mirabilis]
MGLSSVRARIGKMFTRLNRAARRLPDQVRRLPEQLRRWTGKADVWLQDHHIPVVIGMFVLLGTSAGLLLWMDWDTVTAYAKVVAPVFTIISITAGAILGVINWFRQRRTDRLARLGADSATVPTPRTPESDRLTSDDKVAGEENR